MRLRLGDIPCQKDKNLLFVLDIFLGIVCFC